jgi:DNA-binding NarL/FixJ family response regulator
MNPIRVLLADDHRLLRAGIRALLRGAEGIEVVAEASDGREALELIRSHRPHVLLTDITMPGMNGLEAAARVTAEFPAVRVIVLSVHVNEEFVSQAIRSGAAGYLPKDAAPEEVEAAIRTVARGETYLAPAASKHLVTEYMRRVRGETGTAELLTPRQREVLQLIAEGNSNKEIAKQLRISLKTVETHRTQLMERLDIHDVTGLVRYAIRVGIIQAHA